jgi:hypothetical protein
MTSARRTELNRQQAIELKFNVPPNNEAPPHVTAEQMWVNATTYLPMPKNPARIGAITSIGAL